MTELATALQRLQTLRAVVSPEYAAAIDCVLGLLESHSDQIARASVVELLLARAARTDYLVLRSVLHEMAQAVRELAPQQDGTAN